MIAAGILLGMGEAGFFDGILLHQILQWHHMLTSIQPATNIGNLEVNTLWDGLFKASTYGMTVAGLVLLWRAGQRGDFVGGGIHHVKSGPNQLAWDLGFLAIGALLAAVGWILLRDGQRDVTTTEIKN